MDKTDRPSSYEIRQIGREYNDEMLEILRENPIESGGLTLCFDRKPDIFRMAEIKYEAVKYIGYLTGNKLMGFGMVGFHKAYVNGKPSTVFHFTDLYVRRAARNKGFYYRASALLFKEAFDQQCRGYSVILQGNKNAERLIARRHQKYPLIPSSKIIATLDVKTIIIAFKKKESNGYSIRKATLKDSDTIISMLKKEFTGRLFAPCIDRQVFFENLSKRPDFDIDNYYIAEKEGKIAGVCAAWDCRSFKQTTVLRYGNKFKVTRMFYSVLSFLFGLPPLPREGKPFKEVYITDCAVHNRDPLILNALLLRIYNIYKRRKYNTLIFGSHENDPLLNGVKGFFHQAVKSHIVVSSYDNPELESIKQETSKPYIDIALL